MAIFEKLYEEIMGFLSIQPLIDMIRSGDYSSLKTLEGIKSIIGPLIPFLLLTEIFRGLFLKKFTRAQYRIPFFTYLFNRLIEQFISIGLLVYLTTHLYPLAPLKTTFTWYWLIYGYIIWELSHFVYHYFGHKVRLFWCVHSTHHAPEHMNLSVTYAHFFLEAAYADIIRISICFIFGVNPVLLGLIMFIDGTWGAFIHVGENLIRDGRLGFLNRIILTPSHHRVHHAKNPLYMDTNFCNLLNIWDRVFKTYRPEREDMPPVYGITRPMNPGNFWDVYFGEFVALGRDVYKAPGIRNKLLYIVMPPGWSHTGDHKTSVVVRKHWLEEQAHLQKEQTLSGGPASPGVASPEARTTAVPTKL